MVDCGSTPTVSTAPMRNPFAGRREILRLIVGLESAAYLP
jgi:hypothetical protein